MAKYSITLQGCKGNTSIVVDLPNSFSVELLKNIAEKTERAATTPCHPTMSIAKLRTLKPKRIESL